MCAELDFETRTIRTLDSMGHSRGLITCNLLRYLRDEHRARFNRELPPVWRTETVRGIPRQGDGFNCGVFCCYYMDYLLRQRPWDFTMQHSPYMRARVTLALIQGCAPVD